MKKTLGGDRLGSGKKIQVDLHGYERSTHDLGYLWRSTMSSGTLVPFLSEIALPGDTFDINLNCDIKTHPTIGPLFGSYKVQLDIFLAPIRLYNSKLHNNMLGIGLNMSQVKLPQIELTALPTATLTAGDNIDWDNLQINPSCLLSYFGIRGIGLSVDQKTRLFNCTPLLAYWEIYKNYYANKQEEIGAVLHTPSVALITTVTGITITDPDLTTTHLVSGWPGVNPILMTFGSTITIAFSGTQPLPEQLMFNLLDGRQISLKELGTPFTLIGTDLVANFDFSRWGAVTVLNTQYIQPGTINTGKPAISTFPLSNIDDMRNDILSWQSNAPFIVDTSTQIPYKWLTEFPNNIYNTLSSQEGLALKTYQSDILNNWLQTEFIDGTNGITAITAIDTSSGSFTLDTLNLSKKVYDMLNRIAVSGGSYDDWLDAVYTHDRYTRCETPMYMGGLIKELVFQEVVSNSVSEDQPLGTLGGKGIMSKKHKGGHVIVKVDEPGYIIGIISLTPRLDYSQGNKWDTHLLTIDDLHKPALDEIGFQELPTEQMAWWDTQAASGGDWIIKSAGKQPAWINYMTNINQTRGNFAISANEMFMTLNRRYEIDEDTPTNGIKDLTTYIDPSKYNFIFAQSSLDSQNFWTQIAVDITARRKMSAKIMPNL